METALKMLPLAVLAIGAPVLVWRGFRTKPDDTDNRAKGGGAEWDYWRSSRPRRRSADATKVAIAVNAP